MAEPALIGHDAAWRDWRAARAGQRMHHAWMLAGREGLGKAAFARAAAAELVAEPGVAQPDPAGHPDILWLNPLPANEDEAKKRDEGRAFATKRNISVDQVRAMQRRLVTRPTLGARRAVVVDCADQLETASANALLKSLEEPPQGTFFLLIAHQAGRILPTIRSRCRSLRFAPLAAADLARALDAALPGLDAETTAAAIAVGAGAPGAAIAFAEAKLGPAWTIMQRLIRNGDPDLSLRTALSAAIGARPDRTRLAAVMIAARTALAEALALAPRDRFAALADAHAAIAELEREAPIFNYDAGLLLLKIGALLAGVAPIREAAR